MTNYTYKYLIIGGGMTADAAAHSIRDSDPKGTIGLISSEDDPPYARPPLSKALWTGDEELEDIDLGTSEASLEMHLGRIATKIDRPNKKIIDEKGNIYSYTKLLIATGGTPRKLPNIEEKGLIYYRTLSDYKNLKALVDKNNTFGVIGGGFIGSEIAAAIKMYKSDAEVTMIFPESGICALIFPKILSNHLNDYYRENDITVITDDLVTNITERDKIYLVETKSGKKLKFDTVIAGLGIKPNIKLAEEAKLEVRDGIVVNKYLQTNDPDIYAAGDVAIYHNPALDKYIRVEHEDNALMMGEIAGENMTGKEISFDHLSLFYSDLFELGYEAVGFLNSKLEIVEDWKEPLEEGVIYYLKEGRVQGVLLWNVWEKIDEARELIAEPGPFSLEDLKGRIQ
ncbi:MAG: FAD-dependent oxidoreductase [Promethearchaeota archaeon]|nr:MAG: FAD-dependent oxidoreductase [Candidatus Lokiarchaeota archaeon]